MNTLTIDIGNSRIKVEAWADDGFLWRYAEKGDSAEEILALAKKMEIEGIIISSVRKENHNFISKLKESFQGALVEFDNEEIRKFYDLKYYTGLIGPDRIAAFLGAKLYISDKAMMIVDAGTAITIDIADENGNFRGGNISLGMWGRLKTLAETTGKLPHIEDLAGAPEFGTDTRTAIEAGVKNAISGEIYYSSMLAKSGFKIKVVVITGGDMEDLYFPVDKDLLKIEDPYLVGRGLDYHLRTHYLKAPVGYPRI